MQMRRHAWEDIIDDEIREISKHYSARQGLGARPALLCIDNYNAVFGDRAEPVLEAIKRFPSSCGVAAWEAIQPTQQLITAARASGIPIIHSTRDIESLSGATKRQRNADSDAQWDYSHFTALAPMPGELVIRKIRASMFHQTELDQQLKHLGIDSLIVCGNSTSGCVRATVNQAFMLGYRVGIAEECVFDRNWLSHKVNLFDMNAKYADVMFIDEILDYLVSKPTRP